MTTILDDAKMVSSHAKKKSVDADDIKLAVQMYTEENLTTPPGRDVLLETARTRNTMPLPLPKPTCGLRLPPDRYCITNSNYRLEKSVKKKAVAGITAGSTFSNQVGFGNDANYTVIIRVPDDQFSIGRNLSYRLFFFGPPKEDIFSGHLCSVDMRTHIMA